MGAGDDEAAVSVTAADTDVEETGGPEKIFSSVAEADV